MLQFLKQVAALVVLAAIAIVMLYVGFAMLVVFLCVGLLAAIWFSFKFYRIRSELHSALREHAETQMHQSHTKKNDGSEIIEVDYIEVEKETEKRD